MGVVLLQLVAVGLGLVEITEIPAYVAFFVVVYRLFIL